ncbi:MAG: alpha/beta hydrolase [Bacteroidia bacterium]|nr:alpha/beta hydrolase [Bacteroidia bacterium]
MRVQKNLLLIFLAILSSCTAPKKSKSQAGWQLVEVDYQDSTRERLVPLALYRPAEESDLDNMPLVIFSHGYGENLPKSNLAYSYLTEHLAEKGYFVASIQHELPSDSLLPRTGIPQIERRSNWERGATNIRFVLDQLKQDFPQLDYRRVVIMGHSNGGDMSVLFAETYPEEVQKLITLDQRRYAFPRRASPACYSIRSSDQPADEGVIPTPEEQKALGMSIVYLSNTTHNEMDDDANEEQRAEITQLMDSFLEIN